MTRTRIIRGLNYPDVFTVLEEEVGGFTRTIRIHGEIRRSIHPRTSVGGAHKREPFDHWGHLIAHQFGAPGSRRSGNVVPLHGLVNMRGGPWSDLEDRIRRSLGQAPATMVVCAHYHSDLLRPDSFSICVTFADGHVESWFVHNFNPYL